MMISIEKNLHEIFAWILLTLAAFQARIINILERGFNWLLRSKSMADPAEYGLDYSQVSFPSRDGLTLKGWLFEVHDKSHPFIIMLHGVRGNRAQPADRVFGIASELIDYGYNVLVFDFRAHGESEGRLISAGYYERNDLLGAIDYLKQSGATGKIGVLGFSMGAAISLLTAAECKEIAAVVADSSFTDIISILESKLSRFKFLPRHFIPFLFSAVKLFYRIDFTRVKPIKAVGSITVPVFVIHGGKDDMIPVDHAYRLIKACRNLYHQIWIVPEAKHTGAYLIRTEEYILRLLSFFKTAFALN